MIPVDVLFYTLMVVAVVVLRRRRPDLDGPTGRSPTRCRSWSTSALAVLLVVDFVVLAPGTSGVGFLIVLAGIPVYFVWSRSASIGRGKELTMATVEEPATGSVTDLPARRRVDPAVGSSSPVAAPVHGRRILTRWPRPASSPKTSGSR